MATGSVSIKGLVQEVMDCFVEVCESREIKIGMAAAGPVDEEVVECLVEGVKFRREAVKEVSMGLVACRETC